MYMYMYTCTRENHSSETCVHWYDFNIYQGVYFETFSHSQREGVMRMVWGFQNTCKWCTCRYSVHAHIIGCLKKD